MKPEKLNCVTTHQAAAMLGVTSSTVRKWITDKKLKTLVTMGGHRRIPASEIIRIQKLMGFEGVIEKSTLD